MDLVTFLVRDEIVAVHKRDWGRNGCHPNPVHYLAIAERRPNSLDFGKPFEDWNLPKDFDVLRRRPEKVAGKHGLREYIKILRLLESCTLEQLIKAVTGKTHLATAFGVKACRLGKKVRFYRITDPITKMIEARDERTLERLKRGLATLDLSILDELGYVPASKLGSELFFDVISTAYERTSLIVTTNLPFDQWIEILGNARLAGAVPDRLTHRCHILEASGESYRLRCARKQRKTKKDQSLL
jgi:hypothetical protein